MTGLSVEHPRARAPRMTPVVAARDIGGITKRNLLRTIRTPQLVLIGALQPAMLLLLFRYILGGAVVSVGGGYVNFVVPGVFLEAVLLGGMATSIGLAEDVKSGIIDRFRSLPMARSAVLAGRTVADVGRSMISVALMVCLGLLVGFRFHGTIGTDIGGLALVIAFGYSFSWVYATIGLITKNPETAQVAGVLPFFVLVFASSAVVPAATMPGWLQPFARNQPFGVAVSAARALMEGGAVSQLLWQAIAWCIGIFVVFFIISVYLYRNITS
jgi:ABC transporter DrrB family efflux protein